MSYSIVNLIVTNKDKNKKQQHRQDEIATLNLPKLPSLATFIIKKNVFIEQGNNSKLVKNFFEGNMRSFRITYGPFSDSYDQDFDIIWVNTYRLIKWSEFNTQKQIINKVLNLYQVFCSKNGLVKTIRKYEQEMKQQGKPLPIKSEDFIPETYCLNYKKKYLSNDEKLFLLCDTKKGPMILKPCHANQGRGIELIHNIEQTKSELKNQKKFMEEDHDFQGTETHVIQRMIRPALLEGHKFDVRVFILIASVKPLVILFHPGYCRRAIFAYNEVSDNNQSSKIAHLTNQGIQRGHPDFQKHKENTIWSWTKAENALMAAGRTSKQIKEMHDKTKKILRHTFLMGMKDVCQDPGMFELLGADIIYDDQFNPYLLEINSNPALTIDTRMQNIVKPAVVNGTLKILLRLNHEREKINKYLKNKMIDFYPYTELINEVYEEEEKNRKQKLLKEQQQQIPQRPQTQQNPSQRKKGSNFQNTNLVQSKKDKLNAAQNNFINQSPQQFSQFQQQQQQQQYKDENDPNIMLVAKSIKRPMTQQGLSEGGRLLQKHSQNVKNVIKQSKNNKLEKRFSISQEKNNQKLQDFHQFLQQEEMKIDNQNLGNKQIIFSNVQNHVDRPSTTPGNIGKRQPIDAKLNSQEKNQQIKQIDIDNQKFSDFNVSNQNNYINPQTSKLSNEQIIKIINANKQKQYQSQSQHKNSAKKVGKLIQNFSLLGFGSDSQSNQQENSQNEKSTDTSASIKFSSNSKNNRQQMREEFQEQQNKKNMVIKRKSQNHAYEIKINQKLQNYVNKMGNKMLRNFIENEEIEGEPYVTIENFTIVIQTFTDFTSQEIYFIVNTLTHHTLCGKINYRYFLGQYHSKYYDDLETLFTIKYKEMAKEVFGNIANVIKMDKIRISKAFKSFGPDKDGKVSLQQFQKTLQQMNFNYTDKDVDAIFIAVDYDKDYALNFREFKKIIEDNWNTYQDVNQNSQLFDQSQQQQSNEVPYNNENNNNNYMTDYTQNNSSNKQNQGYKTQQQSQNQRKIQENQNSNDIDDEEVFINQNIDFIQKKYESQSENIDENQQQNIIQNQEQNDKQNIENQNLAQEVFRKIGEVLEQANISLKDAFLSMDIDKDKKLSKNDLKTSFLQMSLNYSNNQLNSIIQAVDQDQDGYLNFSEFQKALQL